MPAEEASDEQVLQQVLSLLSDVDALQALPNGRGAAPAVQLRGNLATVKSQLETAIQTSTPLPPRLRVEVRADLQAVRHAIAKLNRTQSKFRIHHNSKQSGPHLSASTIDKGKTSKSSANASGGDGTEPQQGEGERKIRGRIGFIAAARERRRVRSALNGAARCSSRLTARSNTDLSAATFGDDNDDTKLDAKGAVTQQQQNKKKKKKDKENERKGKPVATTTVKFPAPATKTPGNSGVTGSTKRRPRPEEQFRMPTAVAVDVEDCERYGNDDNEDGGDEGHKRRVSYYSRKQKNDDDHVDDDATVAKLCDDMAWEDEDDESDSLSSWLLTASSSDTAVLHGDHRRRKVTERADASENGRGGLMPHCADCSAPSSANGGGSDDNWWRWEAALSAQADYEKALQMEQHEAELPRALQLYEAASRAGHVRATVKLALNLEHQQSGSVRSAVIAAGGSRSAGELYGEAAAAGHPDGQYHLARCHARGKCGVRRDLYAAAELYMQAACAGHVDAMLALGACFAAGTGVDTSPHLAVALYRNAARRGDPRALFRLAACYDAGEGVRRDPRRAARLYTRAADAGLPEARRALALSSVNLSPTTTATSTCTSTSSKSVGSSALPAVPPSPPLLGTPAARGRAAVS